MANSPEVKRKINENLGRQFDDGMVKTLLGLPRKRDKQHESSLHAANTAWGALNVK